MKKVKIGKKLIGEGEPCFISLEPGATHTGLESAKQLLKAVADSGADAVKFQTFLTGEADRMMGRKDIMVDFTTPSGKKKETVYGALKRREMSKEEWKELINYTKELGILFYYCPLFYRNSRFYS